jgi:flagellar hook-associated protein 1 FlgK
VSLGFNTALSALTAARVALQTIGHNIANANTEGYSRQRVLLSGLTPQSLRHGLAVGTGVGVDAIDQVYDPLIASRLRVQTHEVGRSQGLLGVYRDLEAAWGEPSESGLNARLAAFFSALGQLQTSPADSTSRSAVLQSAVGLAQAFRTIAADVGSVSEAVDQAITYEAERVNGTLEDLYQLNRSILSNGFGGNLPPDVRDRQNQLVAKLSQSIDVRVTRQPTGQITVTSAGHVLVDPNRYNAVEVIPKQVTGAGVKLRAGSTTAEFAPKTGRLHALLELAPAAAAEGATSLDAIARELIRAVNHVHATGVPAAGGYTSVVSLHAFTDVDGDGDVLNERLADAGLPFEIEDGLLTINVTDAAGTTRQSRIQVSPSQMTVAGLVAAIDSVDDLTATVDATGQLRIAAAPGTKFDFSARLNPTPDAAGTFGGTKPTISAGIAFPTPIPPGTTFQLAVDGSPPQTITFLASHFANPGAATAAEMAAAINAQVSGATASVVAGQLVIQGNTPGALGSLQLNGGQVVTGQATPVQVSVTGTYAGTADKSLVLKALSDGVIGQTPGLKVEIRQPDGVVLGTLDVGLGYVPGEPLDLGDGISVSFTSGMILGPAGHFVQVDAIAESDQSGILAATGVAAVFDGVDAGTIDVRPALLDTPGLFAAGLGGGDADGSNLARLIAVKDAKVASLGDRTVLERFDLLVLETGSGAERAQTTLETQQLLLDQLEARRLAVSGVNLDEELLAMETFQRSFEVAARYTQTLSEVTQTLMDLLS